MTFKEFWTKAKNIILIIITTISGVIITIFSVLLNKEKKENMENEANLKKEETRNEIENTPAQDLINNSPNQSDIQSDIAGEKDEFRKRISDRLNQNI